MDMVKFQSRMALFETAENLLAVSRLIVTLDRSVLEGNHGNTIQNFAQASVVLLEKFEALHHEAQCAGPSTAELGVREDG